MQAALHRLARRLARRPAAARPDDALPALPQAAPAEPAALGPDGETDWWTWPEHLTVHPLLLAAEQDADAACVRLQGIADKQ
ncbi:hypothetical protein [Kitasatospora phosalacinea]|uniref:hypothetical protein n=1 Tax=Kitasatospora phosalacinea TaxID=2065 RepID=UPI002554D462|nr:hypothetical protein [Kitasatospora phosalacinea]